MDSAREAPPSGDFPSFVRPRLNRLLEEAIKHPVVVVCAGTGCGKTRAVSDYLSQQNTPVAWEQLSDRDNVESRSWENIVNSIARMDKQLGEVFKEFGFPDTEEKRKQFFHIYEKSLSGKQQYIIVIDDFHLVKNQAVIDFVEYSLYDSSTKRKSIIIISREPPPINLAGLQVRGLVAYINEEDLNFTESELAEYINHEGLSAEPKILHEIFQDTKGWAFAVNFVVQSLKKSPVFSDYVSSSMKKDFFQMMEGEVFHTASEGLRHFLASLSLVDHLSAELVTILADNDKSLLTELGQLSSYIRLDSNVDAYMIHHLFLDFLRTKQEILTEEEIRRTYQIAADWCNRNRFKVDAMSYYEKIGDYESIVSIFYDFNLQVPPDIALYAEQIFNRAPHDTFASVRSFAVMHVRAVICLGKWQEAMKLLTYYEAELLRLPEDAFRNYTLGGLYYAWGTVRQLMSTVDDHYDFHVYFARMDEYLTKSNFKLNKPSSHPIGSWFSMMGSSRSGAPQEYIEALACAEEHASRCYSGCMAGIHDLAYGELKYYQGDISAAEPSMLKGIERARSSGQFTLVHRGLLYMMRIAVSQGNSAKAEQALKDTEALLNETNYISSFIAYDITLGMYYSFVLQPERVPGWLKGKFSPYTHPAFIENNANQVKLYYCYITGNHAALLSYMEEQKRRESILYSRVILLAMEACVLFKTKNNTGAFAALREAYETALPNAILMPFIWLGNDMRTLAEAAKREQDGAIPKPWLEAVIRKSTSYAKNHRKFVLDYKKTKGLDDKIDFPPAEMKS
ncbi:MAG: hypothetical protein FWH52_07445 [Synergistaceae bacterium]|nr:hypothetical protein [Synergistaceae bacterium]